VQVFGRRNDGLSTHSDGRRPKSAKAGNRGLGTAVVPQLWGLFVTLPLGHHGPGHPRDLIGERDGGDLGRASA
jgi:hypothetical protein